MSARAAVKIKKLDPRYLHIGFVRFGDSYHPSNEQSLRRWKVFLALIGKSELTIPRNQKIVWSFAAKVRGFQLHFFEKGLGR